MFFVCGFIYYSRLSAHYANSQIMNFYHDVLVVTWQRSNNTWEELYIEYLTNGFNLFNVFWEEN
jgi:hypothetical protein